MDTNKDKSLGRPPSDDPKVHLPSIRIKTSMVEKMKQIADFCDKSQSDIYEEAIDQYIQKYEQIKTFVVRL